MQLYLWVFFFFSSRRRHTRLKGDWSSDVCSSDLLLLHAGGGEQTPNRLGHDTGVHDLPLDDRVGRDFRRGHLDQLRLVGAVIDHHQDRKSTRLNSSHLVISYAVFCLKKKKRHTCDAVFEGDDSCCDSNYCSHVRSKLLRWYALCLKSSL